SDLEVGVTGDQWILNATDVDCYRFLRAARMPSESDSQIPLEPMLLAAIADLTLIGETKIGVGSELEAKAGLDDGSVFRDRHTGDGEGARVGKGQRSGRDGVAEGVAPAERAVDRQVGGTETEGRGGMDAERREGRHADRAMTVQRGDTALLGQPAGVEAHVSEVGERLESTQRCHQAIAQLTEGLERARTVV